MAYSLICVSTIGLPRWLSGKESACQCRRRGFDPWVGKIPWRRKWQPTPVYLLGNPMDRKAWQATVHRVTKRVGHDSASTKHHLHYHSNWSDVWKNQDCGSGSKVYLPQMQYFSYFSPIGASIAPGNKISTL